MLAPLQELQEYTGCTQSAAVVRRLRALGAPCTRNAAGRPALPGEWWDNFKRGHIAAPLIVSATVRYTAANDEPAGPDVDIDALRRVGRGPKSQAA